MGKQKRWHEGVDSSLLHRRRMELYEYYLTQYSDDIDETNSYGILDKYIEERRLDFYSEWFSYTIEDYE